MSYANLLTLGRLMAVVPMMGALYIQFPGNRVVATVFYIAAINWGKAKMVSQSIAVLILLFGYIQVGYWAMLIATILTLLSGWSYLKDAPKVLAASAGEGRR